VAEREGYVARIAREIAALPRVENRTVSTVYFGGGTPALCDLRPVCTAVREAVGPVDEFTVELNPRDVTPSLLSDLRELGVNRVSMGVQSLDDKALSAMGRPHSASMAEDAFTAVRKAGFDNAGFDLIAGWPGTTEGSWRRTLERAVALGPDHVSVYTLIREPGTALDVAVGDGCVKLPGDDEALVQHDMARVALVRIGLERYEVSNFARPGRECRHNLAVWRGEDYVGIGEGAHGRVGKRRTVGMSGGKYETSLVSPEADARERALFALRLAEGIDLDTVANRWPVLAEWIPRWKMELESLATHEIVRKAHGNRFVPTCRGMEVCDAVMARLA